MRLLQLETARRGAEAIALIGAEQEAKADREAQFCVERGAMQDEILSFTARIEELQAECDRKQIQIDSALGEKVAREAQTQLERDNMQAEILSSAGRIEELQAECDRKQVQIDSASGAKVDREAQFQGERDAMQSTILSSATRIEELQAECDRKQVQVASASTHCEVERKRRIECEAELDDMKRESRHPALLDALAMISSLTTLVETI